MNPAQCDIIIPIFNRFGLTKKCLKAISDNTTNKHNYNLVLIDNASEPETKNFLEAFISSNKRVFLIRNQNNIGWVKAINQGMRLSTSPYVCIMNNDAIAKTNGWLLKLIKVAESESDIGLVNPSFKVKKAVTSKKPFIEVDFCRGYCILIKRAVIEKIGLLDESYGLGYYDDDDYSVRAIQAGFRCVRANDVFVEHLRDSTFSYMLEDKKRIALHEANKMFFYSKWGKRLKLVFIITKSVNRRMFSDILFSLARRQHIINLWNLTIPLNLEHINIRESNFPRFLHGFIFSLILYLNRLKRKAKQYDILFVDSERLNLVLSSMKYRLYRIDVGKDNNRISEIVDSISRTIS